MNFVSKLLYDYRPLRVAILLFCGMLLFVGTSSFNQHKIIDQKFDAKAKSTILKWYDLFLKLESNDLLAYPPISADRIAQIGIAGSLTYDYFKNGFNNQEELTLLTLNRVYSEVISGFFKSNVNSLALINHLENDVAQSFYYTEKKSEMVQLYSNTILNRFNSLIGQKSDNTCNSITPYLNNKWDNFQFKSVSPVLPEWGKKSTLLLNPEDISMNDPYLNTSSFKAALHQDALRVYTQSIKMSKDDQWIAEFWSDDVRGLTFSPAGRWVAITNQIIQKENLAIKDILNLYFKLGIGLNDAATLCWKYKYQYNLQRPSAFINQYIDRDWKPFHDNPNFPSYPSGHAVLGAVSATILESVFGANYYFTDKSHHNRMEFFGQKRSFESIKAMALENAYSRFIMGVHYKEDCEAGLRLGFDVGNIVKKAEISDIIQHISKKQNILSDTNLDLTIENSAILPSQMN